MKTLSALLDYGLTAQQAKVYLCIIELSETTATGIVKKTKIPRASVYKAIDVLIDEKLVSRFQKNKSMHFAPTVISQMEKNLLEKLESVRSVGVLLEQLSKSHETEVVFETDRGVTSVERVYNALLQSMMEKGERELCIISGLGSRQYVQKFLKNWKIKVSKANIYTKMVLPESIRQYSSAVDIRGIERRFYGQQFVFEGSLLITPTMVCVITYSGVHPTATTIRSTAIVLVFQSVWNMLWSRVSG
jgi:sugar-specific transcriptional regulator TrmB